MPNLAPDELAEHNLRLICAITGAVYYPDHSKLSPLDTRIYPGPWVRVILNGIFHDIAVGHIIRHKGLVPESTCYFVLDSPVTEAWIAARLPHAEIVATALLLLRNNPALFDEWRKRNGPHA